MLLFCLSNLNKNEIEGINGESGLEKDKDGNKRKFIEMSKCNGDERDKKKKVRVQVNERVLQLRSMVASSGGAKETRKIAL